MALLSREEVLAHSHIKKELVNLPEWGGEVYVRTMTGHESDAFTEMILAHEEKTGNNRLPHLKATLAYLTVCDERGGRLFSADDLDALLAKDATALNRIFEVARRLNGLGAEEEETITKNSESVPTNSSGSDSPLPSDVPSEN